MAKPPRIRSRSLTSELANVCAAPSRQVNIGNVEASRTPLRLQAVLGSCVSVCLFDSKARIGGMNHILVPSSIGDSDCTARYGVQAMELLINALMSLGADRRRFMAKAFGGGNVLSAIIRKPSIGELNTKFVREFLRTERIPLVAERLGGDRAVRVTFCTESSRAFIRDVGGLRLPAIVREEAIYYDVSASARFLNEEPTIF